MERLRLDKEKHLVKRVAAYFRSKGFKTYFEVPIASKICDILCYNSKANLTIAIEVKVSKWRNAIKQARVYQFGVDEAFIAIPEIFIHRLQNNQEMCSKYGIGIISVNNKIKIILKPSRNKALFRKLKEETIESLGLLEKARANYAYSG